MHFWYLLLEAVPQNASRVLHDTDISSNVGLLVLYKRRTSAFPGDTEQSPQFTEPGKSPVSLFCIESVRSH